MNSLAGRRAVAESEPGSNRAFGLDAFAIKYGGVTVSRLKAGAVLYSQGEPADAVFYIEDGQVQITVVSNLGRAAILGVLGRDDLCGEGCLLYGRIRDTTAICTAESTIARLERSSVIRALREDAAVAEYFVAFALSSVVRLRHSLISQLFDSSEQRLARVLCDLARHDKDGRSLKTIRNLDQEKLAQMIGTTRSRVNQFMNKFRRLGYIEYDSGGIRVHTAALEATLRDDALDRRLEAVPIQIEARLSSQRANRRRRVARG